MRHGGKREGAGSKSGVSKLTEAREQLLQHSDTIIAKLMEKVAEGDTVALRLAVERIIPIVRDEPVLSDEEAEPVTSIVYCLQDTSSTA